MGQVIVDINEITYPIKDNFFNTGMTFAIFKTSGKIPSEKDQFIHVNKSLSIPGIICLSTLDDKLSQL